MKTLREARKDFEREYFSKLLPAVRWRVSEAAKVAGMNRCNLYRKLGELGLIRRAA